MYIPGYTIERLIAEGGMASVYLAVQDSLDRPVALKILRKFDTPEQAQRFFNEGKIIASLNHRNVITIYDLGVVDERHYLAMEFLRGGDLRARINAGMTPLDALNLLEVLAECLSFVHSKGIVHRDIKPENILFRHDGVPVLTDFGVAKHAEDDHALTIHGTTIGSPHYLSPEQAECKPLDGRADIYSLGVVFYEMLTGVKPFQGDSSIEIIIAHFTQGPPILPPYLQYFQPLLAKMIAKDPADRFSSADELSEALRQSRDTIPHDKLMQTQPLPVITTERQTTGETQTVAQQFALAHIREQQARPFKLAATAIALIIAAILAIPLLHPSAPKPEAAPYQPPEQPVVTPEIIEVPAVVEQPSTVAPAPTPAPKAKRKHPPDANSAMQQARDILDDKQLTIPKLHQAHQLFQLAMNDEKLRPEALGGANIIANQLIAIEDKIHRYQTGAETAIEENKLTAPPKSNAFYYYRQILALDPDNSKANEGIGTLANIYADRVEAHLQQFETAAAEEALRTGLSIKADHPRLLSLAAHVTPPKDAKQPPPK